MPTRTCSTRAVMPVGLVVLLVSLSCALAGQDLLVKVPFDFRAGETHFRPGEYLLALDRVSAGSVTIERADHRGGAVVHAVKSIATWPKATPAPAPAISFRAYGDSRFLSAIQAGSAGERWDLAPSADEAALSRTKGRPKVTTLRAEILEGE